MAGSSTLSALNALADQVPGLNQRALKQVQAARDIGLQRQIQAAPKQGAAPAGQQAQALATQRALQAGQDIVAQRQQAAGRAEQIRAAALQERQRVGQAGLQQQQMAQQAQMEKQRIAQLQQLRKEELDSRKTVLESEQAAATRLLDLGIEMDNRLQLATIKQREDLNRIGLDVKRELLDARLQFRKSERGRKFTNERQLADYAASAAKNRNEFNVRMSRIENAHKKDLLIWKTANSRLEAALQRGYLKEKGDLDFETKKKLAQMKAAADERIRREEAKARNRQAMYQAGGMIVGGVAGGLVGGPGGAMMGAQVGSAGASVLAGSTA